MARTFSARLRLAEGTAESIEGKEAIRRWRRFPPMKQEPAIPNLRPSAQSAD
jgi:hypothetical protein